MRVNHLLQTSAIVNRNICCLTFGTVAVTAMSTPKSVHMMAAIAAWKYLRITARPPANALSMNI